MGEPETIDLEITPTPEIQSEPDSGRVFSSSIFSNLKEEGKSLEEKDRLQSSENVILEPEDVRGILEMPFDLMALKTKYPGWNLTDEEAARLCRIWVKPIQRLCGKYKQLDLVVAVSSLGSLIIEKQLMYMIEQDNQKRNRTDDKK